MRLSFVFMMVMLVGCGCSHSGSRQEVPDSRQKISVAPVVFTKDLIDAHNSFRKSKGMRPLFMDSALQKACEEHARDMAKTNKMSHTGSDGSSPFQRMMKNGYNWITAGENIAWNQQTVVDVMKTWEWSLGHRMNILNVNYTNIGAACVYNARHEPYWCVDFGTPSRTKVAPVMSKLEIVTEAQIDASSVRVKSDR